MQILPGSQWLSGLASKALCAQQRSSSGPGKRGLVCQTSATTNHSAFPSLPSAESYRKYRGLNLIQQVHQLHAEVLREGDCVVDATAGNGHDTLHAAWWVGPSGIIHVFDIQQEAIDTTRSRLESSLGHHHTPRMHYHYACHSRMAELVPEDLQPRVVCFNLGYLPHGDKSVVTKVDTTLTALKQATKLVGYDGIMTVVAYRGHPGGTEEFFAVKEFLTNLPPAEWAVYAVEPLNRTNCAVLLVARRLY